MRVDYRDRSRSIINMVVSSFFKIKVCCVYSGENRPIEAILMSTHNIHFQEKIKKSRIFNNISISTVEEKILGTKERV